MTTDQTLDDNASGPKEVKTPTALVQQFDLDKQIAYEQYKEAKAARASGVSPLCGLRIGKARYQGTVDASDIT